MSTRGGVAEEGTTRHGTRFAYVVRGCRCPECSALMRATSTLNGWRRKAADKEVPREPVSANVVVFPGAPKSQCPQCSSAFANADWREWPAVEVRGARYVYGCARRHRWFARGAYERP